MGSRTRLTREETQSRTRQDLLEAAAAVFARCGFHGASVDKVAAEGGYTKGAVYSNFGSKDELFLAVLESRMQAQAGMFTRLEDQAQAVAGTDLSELVPPLDWVDETWCLLLFEFWLYALRHPSVRERLAALYAQFRAQLAPLLTPYTGPHMHPHELAGLLIAAYQGLALQAHSDPDALRPDLIARLLTALAQRRAEETNAPTRGRPRRRKGTAS